MYEKASFKRMAEFEGWPEGYSNVILCKTLSGLKNWNADGRGRDEDCSSPPAQIPAGAANAPGSSLGFWRRNGGRAAGVVSLLAERSGRRG